MTKPAPQTECALGSSVGHHFGTTGQGRLVFAKPSLWPVFARLTALSAITASSAASAHAEISNAQPFSMVCERIGEKIVESHKADRQVAGHDVTQLGSWTVGRLTFDPEGRGPVSPEPVLEIASETFSRAVLKARPEIGSIHITESSAGIFLADGFNNLVLVRHVDGVWRGAWTKGSLLMQEGGAGHSMSYTALVCQEDAEGRGGAR